MKLMLLVGALIATLYLFDAQVYGMQLRNGRAVAQERKKEQADIATEDAETKLLTDIWMSIENIGVPLELAVFDGKFSLEQIYDFLQTIEAWQSLHTKFQNLPHLRRMFEDRYRGILYVDLPDRVRCAICGREYQFYAPCVNHILRNHFQLKEIGY